MWNEVRLLVPPAAHDLSPEEGTAGALEPVRGSILSPSADRSDRGLYHGP